MHINVMLTENWFPGFIHALERALSTMYVTSRWETEGNIQLTEDDWLNMCRTQSTTSSSDLWRELTWKNILRSFITPTGHFHISLPMS